jgi:hypothetical protein
MNEPLTIHFVGGFFFGTSLATVFRQDLREKVGGNSHLWYRKWGVLYANTAV